MSGAYKGDPGAEVEESARYYLGEDFSADPEFEVVSTADEPLTVRHLESGREFMLEVRAMPLGSKSDG